MKILVIGLNYAPEPVGIGPYTTAFAEWLAARGHTLEAVVGEPYYPQWQRPGNGAPGAGRSAENGVTLRRCRIYIPAEPTAVRRIVHHASFALAALPPSLGAAMRMRPDLVFTVSPSLLSLPVAWLVARLSGAKLWAHVQDFEVEAAFATGLLDAAGAAGRIAAWLERRFLALADRVSTISPQMVARLHAMGIAADRTYQLRNWASQRLVPDEADADRYRREWDIGSRKVALYAGSIANKQGIGIVIEAARQLRQREDLVFVICGRGPNRRKLVELAAGLPNVQLHDLQPTERMGGLLALADVHLLPQIAGASDLVLPSKLCNILASRRPVVATAEPGTGLAIEIEGCGLVTAPGDADAFAAAVLRLVDDPALAATLGETAGGRAAERWSHAEILAGAEAEFTALAPRSDPLPIEPKLTPDCG